jgi:hypothetical protein
MKINLFVCALICITAFSRPSLASKVIPKSERSILAKYSLSQFAQTLNVLMAASTSFQTPICGLDAEHAGQLSEVFEPLLKAKLSREIKRKKLQVSEDPETCLASCNCSVESSLLEQVGFERLSDSAKRVYRRVSTLALQQTPQDIYSCALKAEAVCSSELFKYLKSQSLQNNN